MSVDERLAVAFVTDHPEDAARLLERADAAEIVEVMRSVPAGVAASVFRALNPASATACAAHLADETLGMIVDALPLDDAGAAMRRIDAGRRDRVLALLGSKRAAHLRAVLAYPPTSAGALADPLVLALTDDINVADAQRQLRGGEQHLFYYVYVVTRERRLVGVLAMPELMAARPKAPLSDVMRVNVVKLEATAELATFALHPAWRDLDALPVVDAHGRLVGAIRHKTMRQTAAHAGRPMIDTIVSLGELYWAGLAGMLATIATATGSTREKVDVP